MAFAKSEIDRWLTGMIGGALYAQLRTGNPLARALFHSAAASYNTLRFVRFGDRPPLYCHERVVEIPWALRQARALPRSARILEVGDVVGGAVAKMGHRVVTVDINPQRGHAVKGHTYVRADARDFHSDAPFDAAFSISTIEHIGLGHYGDPIYADGDLRAIRSIASALKPGGRLFLTVPFGRNATTTWQRKYDFASLRRLLGDWTTYHAEIFAFDRWRWRQLAFHESRGDWIRSSEDIPPFAVAVVAARKLQTIATHYLGGHGQDLSV